MKDSRRLELENEKLRGEIKELKNKLHAATEAKPEAEPVPKKKARTKAKE